MPKGPAAGQKGGDIPSCISTDRSGNERDRGKTMKRSVLAAILCITFLSVLAACSSEKNAGPGAVKKASETKTSSESSRQVPAAVPGSGKEMSIEITPSDANRTSVLKLTARGFVMARADTEWLVNGIAVPDAVGASFKAEGTTKGDQVQAQVVVQGRELESNTVEIHDAPPVIRRIKFVPEVFKPGDRFGVDVAAEDPDGDDVTIRYQWTKNGESAGDGSEIEGGVSRGDKIEVRIVPFDGEMEGTPVILKREISNMPPTIEQGGKFHFDGSLCTYQVKASDPDGDTLTYSLKGAPAGMTIDRQTGTLRWTVPDDFAGKVSFAVAVNDGHGGVAQQRLNLTTRNQ